MKSSSLFAISVCVLLEINSAVSKRPTRRQTETEKPASDDEGTKDLDTRFYLANLPSYDCYTRMRDPGRCVSLNNCPTLKARVRNVDRVYLLQSLSDYVCGYGSTILVCCPARSTWDNPQATYLRPPQSHHHHSNDNWTPNRPNQGNGLLQPVDMQDDDIWGRPNQRPTDRPNRTRPSQTGWGDNRPNQSGWRDPSDNRPNQPGWRDPSDNRPNQSGWRDPSDNRPNQSGWRDPSDNRPSQTGWSDDSAWPKPTGDRPSQSGWPEPSSDGGAWPTSTGVRPDPSDDRPQGGDRGPSQFPGSNPQPVDETPSRIPTEDSNGGSSNGNQHKNRALLPKTCGADVMANRIIFGNDTALGEYPWIALIRIRTPGGGTFYGCGGSLIHPRYVLTAAHCVNIAEAPSAKVDQVRLGEHDTRQEQDCEGKGEYRECSNPPQNIDVEERIVHKGYVSTSRAQTNDIALLRLKRPAVISKFVIPICLPLDTIGQINYDDKPMWVAGWGRTSNDPSSSSPIKQKVSLPVVPDSKCRPIYKKSAYKLDLIDTQMCAGGGKADSCKGDSGGPLMSLDQVGATFKWHVQGVVSIGPEKCGTVGMPGIYSRVNMFVPWILDNMRE